MAGSFLYCRGHVGAEGRVRTALGDSGRGLVAPWHLHQLRREDTTGYAGCLYGRLAACFGDEHLFRDLDRIGLGMVSAGVGPSRRLLEALRT